MKVWILMEMGKNMKKCILYTMRNMTLVYKYKVNCKVKADKFVDDYTTTCILIEDSVNNRNVSSSNSG